MKKTMEKQESKVQLLISASNFVIENKGTFKECYRIGK